MHTIGLFRFTCTDLAPFWTVLHESYSTHVAYSVNNRYTPTAQTRSFNRRINRDHTRTRCHVSSAKSLRPQELVRAKCQSTDVRSLNTPITSLQSLTYARTTTGQFIAFYHRSFNLHSTNDKTSKICFMSHRSLNLNVVCWLRRLRLAVNTATVKRFIRTSRPIMTSQRSRTRTGARDNSAQGP